MIKQFFKETPFGLSLMLFVLASAVVILIAPIAGNKALIVRSGSMQPAVGIGDLITVKPQPAYKSGDVIAFKEPGDKGITVTHRIVSVETKEGRTFYKTKGDANETADETLVPINNVLGRADYSIRNAGKLFAFAKTKEGFLTIAIIPAALVIFWEVLNIIQEVNKIKNKSPKTLYKKVFKKFYHHYGKPMGVDYQTASFANLFSILSERINIQSFEYKIKRVRILSVMLPIFAAVFLIQNTFAFFSDTSVSSNNVFLAASSFPSPSPSPSVSPSPSPTETP